MSKRHGTGVPAARDERLQTFPNALSFICINLTTVLFILRSAPVVLLYGVIPEELGDLTGIKPVHRTLLAPSTSPKHAN